MEFKPCVIVPVYRHENTVRAVVQNLHAHNLPVVIVDDGNTPEALQVLQKVAEEIPNVMVVSHSVNMGKGGAVCTGCKEALKAGFTPIITILITTDILS